MKRILFFFTLLLSVAVLAQQRPQNQKGATPIKVQFMGKSKKLTDIRSIPTRMKANANDVYVVPNKLTKIDQFRPGPNTAPDPVMQKAMPELLQGEGGQVLQGFDGASNADNGTVNGIRVTPPDTQGDVGPNHYIQMTNSLTTIYDKSGNILFGPEPNSVFFQDLEDRLAQSNDGDPVVLYDEFADRWIISQFAVNAGTPFAMLVAVSTTPDPLGTYNQYAIFYGDDFPDYPKLGVWNDALYISTRDFNPGFIGFSLVALNRDDILNGVADPRAQRFQILNPGFDGILPADADGDLLPPNGEAHPSMYMGGSNELNLILTTVDFDNPANSTMIFDTVPIAPFNVFTGSVPQPNGQDLDALPNFLMYRLQYRNFGTHASMITNHSVQEVAGGPFGVRWYEFRDTGATTPWEVFQQGTFLPDDGLNRWMGSAAMNGNGDIAIGYSVASATQEPSIRFVGQTASESGTGVLNIPEASILEGVNSMTDASRWGDYSMMSVDPSDDDFWFTTEYVGDFGGFAPWATWISEMTFGEPPVAVCQDIELDLDAADGTISITPEDIDNGSTDASGGNDITLSLDIDTFDCGDAGENIVTLTVTDADGITASCTAVVTLNVTDEEAPVAVCSDLSLQLDGESIEITAEDLDGGSTDNCAIAEFAVDQSVFTETGTFTVTLTVTDVVGLTDSCEATVTISAGPEIEVAPLELDAAVDLETTDPPVDEETFTITNNGGLSLDFDIAVGDIDFTPEDAAASAARLANLDRSIYTGNGTGTFKSVKSDRRTNAAQIDRLASVVPVVDSLFLDNGTNDVTAFVGLDEGGPAFGFGLRFVAPAGGFNLNAVRNGVRTEDFGATEILIQVYGGDALPDPTQLLTEQLATVESVDGSFNYTILDEPQQFEEGEVFWIMNNYPMGIDFPQAHDGTGVADAADYAITFDGGATFANQGGFAILTRAIDALAGFISLSPESGSVAPGESVEVTATFDATGLSNGVFESDILVSSNDVNTPEVTVASTFTVTGVPADPLAVLTPDFVQVSSLIDQVQDVEITLRNDGDSDLEFSFPQFAASLGADTELYRAELIDFPNFPANPKKGFEDTRKGNPVPFGSGADLSFGYTWTDSDEAGGPTNNFVDITGTGTDITEDLLDFGFSDATTSVTLPFTFNFYGEDFTELFINGNGIVAFTDPGLPTFTNQQIPVNDNANNIIAPFWDDLEADGADGSSVHVDANADRVIVQWTNAPAFLQTGTVTFQVVLFPDGSVEVYYEDVETASFLANSTIGIENADGSDGAQVAFNTAFVRDDFAIRFTPPTRFITGVAPNAGTVAPGEEQILAVTVDATGLEPGVFTENLTVTSNSVDTSSSTSTFELTVVDAGPEIEVSPDSFDVTLVQGTTSTDVLTISNVGGLDLDFDISIDAGDQAAADFASRVAITNSNIAKGFTQREVTLPSNPEFNTIQAVDGLLTVIPGDVFAVDFEDFALGEVLGQMGWGGSAGSPGLFSVENDSPADGAQHLRGVTDATGAEQFVITPTFAPTDAPISVMSVDVNYTGTNGVFEVQPQNPSLGSINTIVRINADRSIDVATAVPTPAFVSSGFSAPEGYFNLTIAVVRDGLGFTVLLDGMEIFAGTAFAPDIENVVFSTQATAAGSDAAIDVDNLDVSSDGRPIVSVTPNSGTLAPGESIDVDVLFDARTQELGEFDRTISIESNDMGNPTVEVPVTLTVIDDSTGAIIETDPENGETIDFGQVTIGESGDATVTISNVGDQPLIVAQFETSDETFSSDAVLPLEIAPGGSEEVTVSFTPDEEGVVNAELGILSNDTQDNDEIVIFLTGEGIEDVVDPSDLTFILINATTDTPIGPVVDGDVINLGDFPANTTFNIEVLTGDLDAGSVIFDFNGDTGFRTENVAPYALGGDRNGDFFGVNFPIGVNTVRATAFSGRRGTGDLLATETINIEFTPEGSQVPSAIDVILIDAGADTAIGSIEDGQVIDLADLDAVELSIEAIADFPSIGSVRFGLNGDANFRTENVAPYALNGDRSGDFNPINLLGENTLTVSVFQNRNGNGALLETITINFTVIDGAGALVQISPNPASDTVAVSMVDGDGGVYTGTLFNFFGQAVFSNVEVDLRSGNSTSLSVSGLAQGVYILELRDAKGVIVSQTKLVKK